MARKGGTGAGAPAVGRLEWEYLLLRATPRGRTAGRTGDGARERSLKLDIEWAVGISAEHNKRISSQLEFALLRPFPPAWAVARLKSSQLLQVFRPLFRHFLLTFPPA